MPAFNVLDFVHHGASRLQQIATHHLPALHVTRTASNIATVCNFRSTFVQHLHTGIINTNSLVISEPSSEGYLQVTSIDGVLLTIVSYLDGESLSRLLSVNSAWHAFVQQYREPLYRSLLNENATPFRLCSSSAFKSYLLSFRHELDRELGHTFAVLDIHQALEKYCHATEQHGFVAMFCDILEFHDPKLARLVAWKRQSALSMVLAMTPDHVMNFRKQSRNIGPVTFVPVDNPHWPVFTLTPVQARGFMGYVLDHVTMVKGYEQLKDTVVKSILKELMIFDTTENAAAYERSSGQKPYAIILNDEDTWAQVEHSERIRHLSFSSHLRRKVANYPVATRIQHLRAKIQALDAHIAMRAAAGDF